MFPRCEPCGLFFADLVDHIRHQANTPHHYVCDHAGCQQYLFGKARLSKGQVFADHYATAHFPCPVQNCGTIFYSNGSEYPGAAALQDHYRLRHWELYCPFCDKVFESKTSATTHQFEGHPKCQICQQVFITQEEKATHNKVLHGRTKRTHQQCPNCKYLKTDGFECLCDRTRSSEERQKWYRPSGFDPNSSAWEKSNSRSQSNTGEQQEGPTPSPADYYTLLGVHSNASHTEILKAAKRARIAAHPDRCSGQNLSPKELEQVVDHSKAVGQAADVLTDAEKRVRYDAQLRKESRGTGRLSQSS